MPFGLTNAPLTFQATMNDLLRSYRRLFVLVFFFYDILIYSPTIQDHLTHLDLILNLLETILLFAKLSNYSFTTTKVSSLGHIISPVGVAPNPEKIKSIKEWSQPRPFIALRAFLDLTEYYKKFVRSYATLVAPFTDLLHYQRFIWPYTT